MSEHDPSVQSLQQLLNECHDKLHRVQKRLHGQEYEILRLTSQIEVLHNRLRLMSDGSATPKLPSSSLRTTLQRKFSSTALGTEAYKCPRWWQWRRLREELLKAHEFARALRDLHALERKGR